MASESGGPSRAKFKEHSVNFKEHLINFREQSVHFREQSIHFREQPAMDVSRVRPVRRWRAKVVDRLGPHVRRGLQATLPWRQRVGGRLWRLKVRIIIIIIIIRVIITTIRSNHRKHAYTGRLNVYSFTHLKALLALHHSKHAYTGRLKVYSFTHLKALLALHEGARLLAAPSLCIP
jgi:hypothetical protein